MPSIYAIGSAVSDLRRYHDCKFHNGNHVILNYNLTVSFLFIFLFHITICFSHSIHIHKKNRKSFLMLPNFVTLARDYNSYKVNTIYLLNQILIQKSPPCQPPSLYSNPQQQQFNYRDDKSII